MPLLRRPVVDSPGSANPPAGEWLPAWLAPARHGANCRYITLEPVCSSFPPSDVSGLARIPQPRLLSIEASQRARTETMSGIGGTKLLEREQTETLSPVAAKMSSEATTRGRGSTDATPGSEVCDQQRWIVHAIELAASQGRPRELDHRRSKQSGLTGDTDLTSE
jgi:hypothetical protein